ASCRLSLAALDVPGVLDDKLGLMATLPGIHVQPVGRLNLFTQQGVAVEPDGIKMLVTAIQPQLEVAALEQTLVSDAKGNKKDRYRKTGAPYLLLQEGIHLHIGVATFQ